MRLFGRRVPEVVAAVTLEPGERRTAWGLTPAGEPVVATDRGLRLPGAACLDWPDVEKATWARPMLTVVRVSTVAGTGERRTVHLEQEGGLPDVVRGAVTDSVAWSSHYRLSPAGGVRVVGRRRPAAELLDWQLVYDPGTDLSDPLVQQQAGELLLSARRTVG
ncbi:MAG: hypothetical protein AVDCRST_MAG07-490 [uncultured Frankineae bacterium]|uniref:Uncharacterized protein n=1 Tax=uncultured Frankineae bacterium TaxID=437475 RepID=A0A6J4KMY2_9ACTN|nr:MAG: hypothetical protein AVDCRST_MAG07-490 [uncultured Frankineae bacterium]